MSDLADEAIRESLREAVSDVNPPDRWAEIRGESRRGRGGARLAAVAAGLLAVGLGAWVMAPGRESQVVTTDSAGSRPEVVITMAPIAPAPEFDTHWLGEEIVVDRDLNLDDLDYLRDDVLDRIEATGRTAHDVEVQVLGTMEGYLSYRYQYSTDVGSSLRWLCWHRGVGHEIEDVCRTNDLVPSSGPLGYIDGPPNPDWIEIEVTGPPVVVSLTQDNRSLWQRPVGGLVAFPADPGGNVMVITAWYPGGHWMDSGIGGPGSGVSVDQIDVELTEVGGFTVSVEVAEDLDEMVVAARHDGIDLRGDGYRSLAEQWDPVYREVCDRGGEGGSLMLCETNFYFPQLVFHARGLAVDLVTTEDGLDRPIAEDDPEYRWLVANAGRFGFSNAGDCCAEPDHWSVTGY